MAHTSQTEIERKYAVEGEHALPPLEGVGATAGVVQVTSLEPFTLEAVYFDTAELALARARIALRHRQGGHDEGWHVKLPAAEGRTELQFPLGEGDPQEVPAEVAEVVRVHVRDHALTPLARVVTTRRVTELRDAEGGLVAEIADDAVQATDARQGTARVWHEWEAELGPAAPATRKGRTALLDELEQHLLAAGATVSPSVSKLAQALGRTGLGSDESAPSSSSKPTATDVVRAGVAELVQRLVELDPAVRRDDEDAVHRFRTTVRRLRNVLAIHRGLFDDTVVAGLRDRLSRLGAVLGEVRDLEVRADWAAHELDAFARERGIDDPDALRRLVEDTRAEHAEAHQRLVRVLGQGPYFRLLEDLEEFAGVGATTDSSDADTSGADAAGGGKAATSSPKKEARKAVKRTGRRALTRATRIRESLPVLSDAQPDADGSELVAEAEALGALHDSRKAARRLRHAAEFSTDGPAGVLGSSVATVGESAEDLQDALGRHRDASLFAEFVLLTSRRAEAAGESSFTYGVLYQRSLDQARQALDAADGARKALRRLL
ncbi:CYTH and CHAD domain-containing protein [Herbiconiux sp. VKM Ac-1786]|uniref:CYTH and CHAD domain-containing protein n=1 Tax=Herbiconiux sp. VKM Ac-1786 TaxID=2783824 RepID=UPI00188A1633|nr:CYTH and CHAD domain-containing protein [Herbiconiux sp. VKM Ac-1786]MBF4573932.1 CYTH and CHAD domain-containing protein [Herbiconiux sp. VKM Ac-1786]